MASNTRWQASVVLLVMTACDGDSTVAGVGGSGGQVVFPGPLGPIAAVTPTETDRFATSGTCNQCHLAGDSELMHDPQTEEDLSPGYQWRSSMMALAARDPYYLAVFKEQLDVAEGADSVAALCTRCHSPAGSEELRASGDHLGLEELLTGSSPAANLGRDGVTCTLCHQIGDRDLGDVESFTGGFEVGFDREMFGPYEAPVSDPMQFFVEYTPTFSEHIASSELCATCHTVITPVMQAGEHVGDFVEQAPYFEWQNSSYEGESTCQQCHLPRTDAAGTPIVTPIATYPDPLGSREPFGVHSFEGANAYMLTMFARNVEWSGSGLDSAELDGAAARSVRHLETAAELSIASPVAESGLTVLAVTVTNRTGHKLPTGYPGRRLWLHVRAEDDGGAVLFESGRWNDAGSIVDDAGAPLDGEGELLPHRDVVSSPAEVALWESVPGGWSDEPVLLPLAAVAYAKDNRILPEGWSDSGPWTQWTHPVGVGSDATYGPGSDTVEYRLPSSAASVTVDLVYQSVPPAHVEHIANVPSAAAVRFTEMAAALPPLPVVIASAERGL